VSQDVLLHIQMVKDPISDFGLSRSIIDLLNKESIFLNKFEMSLLDENKIKIASIIKFALRYLITLDVKDDRKNLFFYWDGDKEALKKMDDSSLDKYKKFCVEKISIYFKAIKKRFNREWHDSQSKILSVISINGFIMSYLTLIDKYGIKDFEFYDRLLSKLDFDFSKDNFPYTSSQYAKFSREIIKKLEIELKD
jgi:dgqhr domain protein